MNAWGTGPVESWRDQYDKTQEPKVEPVDDLTRFVLDRIREAETEPRADQIPQNYSKGEMPIAYRYAGYVRQDMVAFRRIVALYCECAVNEKVSAASIAAYRVAVKALAVRWSQHHDFRDEWRL